MPLGARSIATGEALNGGALTATSWNPPSRDGAVDGDGLALILVGPSGVIAIAGDGERQVCGAGDVIRLAVVEGFELGEFVGVFLD